MNLRHTTNPLPALPLLGAQAGFGWGSGLRPALRPPEGGVSNGSVVGGLFSKEASE